MPTTSHGPFTVVGGEVSTAVNVSPGDTIQTLSSGTVDFGGAVIGVGAPILTADGDTWATPSDYPAPGLKKNSLIFRVGTGTRFFQGGVSVITTIPFGESGEVLLRTNDKDIGDNSRGWTVNLIRTTPTPSAGPPPPVPNLTIVAIEAVQSIQRSDNSIPLVQNKRTIIRVYVDSGITNGGGNGAGPNRWAGVTGELNVSDPATGTTFVSALTPFDGSITARPASAIDRNSRTHSLNFELPLTSLLSATLSIRARVFHPALINLPGGSATMTTTIGFTPRPAQQFSPILIIDLLRGAGPPAFGTVVTAILTGILPRFPFAQDGVVINPPLTLGTLLPLGTGVGFDALLVAISTMGLIGFLTPFGGIRIGALPPPGPYPALGAGVARVAVSFPSFIADVGFPTTFAHETGHCFGIFHSRCTGSEAAPIDSRLPANGRTDEVAFNVPARAFVARGTGELMSGCSGAARWPSVRFYNVMLGEAPI